MDESFAAFAIVELPGKGHWRGCWTVRPCTTRGAVCGCSVGGSLVGHVRTGHCPRFGSPGGAYGGGGGGTCCQPCEREYVQPQGTNCKS